MNRLDSTLQQLRQQDRSGLIVYFTAGDPDYASSLQLLRQLGGAGADVIEIGVPFSDPVADGPIIQSAHLRARAAGQTVARTLQLVRELRQHDAQTPVILMSYLNPLMQYGEGFMQEATQAGVDGLILVDLPLEHCLPYQTAATKANLHLIRMTAPGSDDARLASITQDASGFIYHVTLNGTTGSKACSHEEAKAAIARLRRQSPLPIAAGFGISTPEQVTALAGSADLIVVGSKLVDTLAKQGSEACLQLVGQLAQALHQTN